MRKALPHPEPDAIGVFGGIVWEHLEWIYQKFFQN